MTQAASSVAGFGLSTKRAIALFAVVATIAIGLATGILAAFYTSSIDREALLVSALFALVVQLLLFSGLRLAPRQHVIAVWGIGTLVRFVALVIYGFVIVKALDLPMATALVSLAACLFASTLLEPLFLQV